MHATHLLKVTRLEGLSDGIFAIAMTIMVLNLHVPAHVHVSDIIPVIKGDLTRYIAIYVGSFIILGTHWIAMNFQIGLLDHMNRFYLWTNMLYLMVICIIPFSANLLGEYPDSTDSINFYAINLLCASIGQFAVLQCAHYYTLNKKIYTNDIYLASLKRIMLAPVFYLLALMIAKSSAIGAFLLLVAPTFVYIFPGKIDRYESHHIQEE